MVKKSYSSLTVLFLLIEIEIGLSLPYVESFFKKNKIIVYFSKTKGYNKDSFGDINILA